MKCYFCRVGETQVLESRAVNEGKSIRRRRECLKCKKRFTTREKVDGKALWVIKKNSQREPFDRLKIKKGILRAIEKRPVSLEDVDKIIDQVEAEMRRKKSEEVETSAIGKAVMRRLKRLDSVAWLRFASVYLEFNNLRDFKEALKK